MALCVYLLMEAVVLGGAMRMTTWERKRLRLRPAVQEIPPNYYYMLANGRWRMGGGRCMGESKGVGPGPTLTWPGRKQPDIPVEVDTGRLETDVGRQEF